LDENEKWNALMGAEVLLQPSFYESFSMTLLEAWSVATPAVVNGLCDVTRAHCRKSEAGVWYRSYAEFEACLDRLLGDEDLRRELGQQGKTYVEALYRWDDIIDRYLDFLGQVQADL
jgi:glycosyltransferase involved in cell wall biosynthesis